jgi:hypothetical protein
MPGAGVRKGPFLLARRAHEQQQFSKEGKWNEVMLSGWYA